MSGVSEESNLEGKRSEETLSKNETCGTNKKLKRNFCYLCNVQCTSKKNVAAHEKGKKHLKNVNLSKEKKTKSKRLKNQKNKKKKLKKKNILAEIKKNKASINNRKIDTRKALLSTPESNARESNNKTVDSSLNDTSKRKMNHSNHQKPKDRQYYTNPNFDDRYSKYQNAKYSYSNNYGNEGFEYNSRSYSNYPEWNNMHSMNAGPSQYRNYQNFGISEQHYSDDLRYTSPFYSGSNDTSWDNSSRNGHFSFHHSENLDQSFDQFGHGSSYTFEEAPFESESLNSDTITKSNRKRYFDSQSTVTSKSALKSNRTCASNDDKSECVSNGDKSESALKSSPCNNNNSKRCERKQMRSRSLSTSENLDSDNRLKGKTKNSLDSDNTSKEQRIRKFTDSLLDTSHNRISRLIHPSNSKEKAAVNHLITKFSKSKRKENLTRKLRSNSLGSTENNEQETENVNSSLNSLNTEESDEISIILDSKETMSEKNSFLEQNKDNSTVTVKVEKKGKSLKDTDFDKPSDSKSPILVSASSKKPSKKSTKSSGISLSKKSPARQKEENTATISTSSKRKKLGANPGNKEKKQKVNRTECLQKTETDKAIASPNFNADVPTRENSPVIAENLKVTNPDSNSDKTLEIKEEMIESSDINNSVLPINKNTEDVLGQNVTLNSEFSVESLIQLFATGNVKVKEEFYDPVMEAIKGINTDELINAQSLFNTNVEVQSKMPPDSKSSKSKPASGTSRDDNNECLSPVILGSSLVENEIPVSATNNSLSSADSTAPESDNISSTNTGSLTEKLDILDKTKAELPPYLDKLIKELQEISSQEEKVKQNLSEAKSKINEYSLLLEEWKCKKKRLQEEEENLRKQRNDIISSMQSSVKTKKDVEKQDGVGESNITDGSTAKVQNNAGNEKLLTENNDVEMGNTFQKSSTLVIEKSIKTTVLPESDEITILPPPLKEEPTEIIIVDDCEETASKHIQKDAREELVTNVVSNSRSEGFNVRNITAHTTIINCLVVFEDFLYTCSNDSTAKKFSLKDASLAVTYVHTAKNVTEIVVEKVQNEALVFTSCSARVISLFIASSGTKIKTFYPPCTVMSICKGWGKFYAGLANGSVNVYNWKYEEREVVKTESPASRIATAHQGRLHVLVILSSDGHIAIRDAETGLLIRYIKIFVKHPSFMTVYNDLAYLSSSDKVLIILDIMTGRIEKRLYLNSCSTGLSAYEDYIFTISYNGLINCFNKDKSCDKKLYYGAGKAGLTCIHVCQNWVFTGNRKGNVSLLQFDPCASEACEFSKCDTIYGLREDLEYHIEKDHLSKKKYSLRCHWQDCELLFFKDSDIHEKMEHIKKHINVRNLAL